MDSYSRVDDFIREIEPPIVRKPNSSEDYGMYAEIDRAFDGIHEHFEQLRRNQGRIAYSAQNLMSDLSKAAIEAIQCGDEEEFSFLLEDMGKLSSGFDDAAEQDEIADHGNRFSRTMWQENLEAELFGDIWPVIKGDSDMVSELQSWRKFKGNPQAYLYGYLDIVSELGKSLTKELSNSNISSEDEFSLFNRYLVIAESIVLRLSEERHVPGYIINNGFSRFSSFSRKLYTANGTIAHVRRDLNLRLSIRRMIFGATQNVLAIDD